MLEETLSNMPVNLQGHNHQVISNLAKIWLSKYLINNLTISQPSDTEPTQ